MFTPQGLTALPEIWVGLRDSGNDGAAAGLFTETVHCSHHALQRIYVHVDRCLFSPPFESLYVQESSCLSVRHLENYLD